MVNTVEHNGYKDFDSFRDSFYYNLSNSRRVAVICDLDGTLCDFKERDTRGPFDFKKCIYDDINLDVWAMLAAFKLAKCRIILVSGRDEIARRETEMWLAYNNVKYNELFMRPQGSFDKDTDIKKAIYKKHIRNYYHVIGVIDDRKQVVDMWRELGLTCLQVADGDF